jgi:DNA-binding transcriptional regulator GbsR (MarR family)
MARDITEFFLFTKRFYEIFPAYFSEEFSRSLDEKQCEPHMKEHCPNPPKEIQTEFHEIKHKECEHLDI